jgi:hypothetical protein
MPERGETGTTGGFEPEAVIDSALLEGGSRSIVELMMARVPAQVQSHEEAVAVIEQMRAAEQQYLPLASDLRQSSMGNDVQRQMPLMMGSLFLVGLVACLSLVFGVIAFIAAAIVFILYLAVRWRVIRSMRSEARRFRDDLVKNGNRLLSIEKRLMEQEKTA